MSSSKNDQTNSTKSHEEEEEEEHSRAIQLVSTSIFPRILRVAVELNLFEIISTRGDYLSASEISSHLPTTNPEAIAMIERLLRFLASFDILKCKFGEDGDKKLYGLAPVCKYFVTDQNGISIAPLLLLLQDKVVQGCEYHMKDAILEGGFPFNKAHGMHAFDYQEKDRRFNDVFNKAMHGQTSMGMKILLDKYEGFASLKEIVDVGGGFGATLGSIVAKYPHIKGINYDLPFVLEKAPTWPGVQHVGGDMFESVPKGEAIIMKWILHDWSDEKCLKLLKNCWNALPDSGGKVIVVDAVLPENPEGSDPLSRIAFAADMIMLTLNPGGKERTEKEFDNLAKMAGFAATKLIFHTPSEWLMEFYKKI